MKYVIAIPFVLILGALVLGQFRIVRGAINSRAAGAGRFTYSKDRNPELFWLVLLLETFGLFMCAVYLFGLIFGVLR